MSTADWDTADPINTEKIHDGLAELLSGEPYVDVLAAIGQTLGAIEDCAQCAEAAQAVGEATAAFHAAAYHSGDPDMITVMPTRH